VSGELSLQPNQGRAWIASVGILASAVIGWLVVACELLEHFAFPDWETSESPVAFVFALVAVACSLGALGSLLLGIVGYLLWLNRAYWNARALGLVLRETPRAAVLCWFIPFLNLIKPYHVVKALYTTADPDEALSHDRVARWPSLMPVWWGTWVISTILDNLSFRLALKDAPAAQVDSMWLNLLSAPLTTVAGATAILILWSIEARLGRLAERAAAPPRFVAAAERSVGFAGN
jgi:hypothetical protein